MMKWIRALAIPLFFVIPSTMLAGQNAGGVALLSWSATSQVTDMTGVVNPYLYVRFTDIKQFKGAEIDLVWNPPGNQTDCLSIVGISYRTATDCTYLNRGTPVPVETANEPGHYHVGWFNSSCATCTDGTVLRLQLDNTSCVDMPGCFRLTYALVYDCVSLTDPLDVSNAACSLNGGDGGPLCQTSSPVQQETWGGIKALYR